MIAGDNLKTLKEHQARLLDELESSAGHVLDLIGQLKTLSTESEKYADVEGELYAYSLQLELDASDVRKVMDEITGALPDEPDDAKEPDE